jgi:putative endonuclease
MSLPHPPKSLIPPHAIDLPQRHCVERSDEATLIVDHESDGKTLPHLHFDKQISFGSLHRRYKQSRASNMATPRRAVRGITKKYRVTKLVYYEIFSHISDAIAREKQIKGGSRQKKIDLINRMNPEWRDLHLELQH